MRPATKILMMSSTRKDRRAQDDRSDYGYGEPESRFRDRRGREHYNDGRFAPQNVYDGPLWPGTPYIPPVYEHRYDGSRDGRPMNRIGFSLDGQMDRMPPSFNWEHNDVMRMRGRGSEGDYMPFTEETALEWISRMQNADGTTGPHWTMEQTEQARKQRSVDCDPLKFYVTMNMIYSDYCKAAEKVGANSMDFYVYMAKAFLDDKDAQPDKLERYYMYVVQK